MKGPRTIEEFMALPVVELFDEERYIDPITGITHSRPVAHKSVCTFVDEDTVFTVRDNTTGELWVLFGEGRRRVYE